MLRYQNFTYSRMVDAGIGRLLIASLHQGIADVVPTRLPFYENWLTPPGLSSGRKFGLAPLHAVLSFLRLEGEPTYTQIMQSRRRLHGRVGVRRALAVPPRIWSDAARRRCARARRCG